MGWDSNFARLATFTARGTFRALKGKTTPARYKSLLSGAIAVLLEEHPELDTKKARARATKATGAKPAPELLSADMSRGAGSKGRRRSTTKTTGTKAARTRSKTTRKKTTRKAPAATRRRTTTTRKTTRRRQAA